MSPVESEMEQRTEPFMAADQPPLLGPVLYTLLRDRRSAVVTSDSSEALEAAGQYLVRRIRREPDWQVSVMFDSTRDVLLGQFNRLLEPLSMDSARSADQTTQTRQLWVLQLTGAEQIALASLAVRLANDFPAANVVLLLLGGHSAGQTLMQSGPGKHLFAWPLEQEDTAAAPLADVQAPPVPSTSPASADTSWWRWSRYLVVLLIGTLLVAAAAMVWGLYQAQSAEPLVVPSATATESVEPASAAPAALAPPAVEAAPTPADAAEPAVSVPDTATLRDALRRLEAASYGPALTQAPAVVVVDGSTPQTPTTTQTSRNKVPVAPAARAVDNAAWLQGLPAQGWLVQHAAYTTLDELLAWRQAHPVLARGRAVGVIRQPGNQRYFIWLTGPYPSADAARAFARSPGVPADYWVRRISAVRAQLPG